MTTAEKVLIPTIAILMIAMTRLFIQINSVSRDHFPIQLHEGECPITLQQFHATRVTLRANTGTVRFYRGYPWMECRGESEYVGTIKGDGFLYPVESTRDGRDLCASVPKGDAPILVLR